MTTFDVPSTLAGRPIEYRTVASAITVFVGAYLVTASVSGQLAALASGITQQPAEVVALFIVQAIFAVGVVVAGFLLAPADIGRRLIAIGLVVAAIIIAVLVQGARLRGDLGAGGLPLQLTLGNGYFMTALAVGAGWLLVRSAKLGWLALLLTAILIPITFVFVISGIGSAISQIVAVIVSGLVLGAIIVVGRPLRE